MKKGTYIDIYVIMACMSGKKQKVKLRHVNKILKKACEDQNGNHHKKVQTGMQIVNEEFVSV